MRGYFWCAGITSCADGMNRRGHRHGRSRPARDVAVGLHPAARDADGRPVRTVPGEPPGVAEAAAWTPLRLNHYVVKSRDLTPFAERETGKITENNIINERRKEFFADGEDFFNMKRLQLDIAIPGGNFAGTDDATYTMPIPQSVEDNYRQ